MIFLQIAIALIGTVWIFSIFLVIFGAGIPLLRAKRKERQDRE